MGRPLLFGVTAMTDTKENSGNRPRLARAFRGAAQQSALIPRRTMAALADSDAVRAAFSLPRNMAGVDEGHYLAMDEAFAQAGGYDAMLGSLTQHASELGQFPLTSFIGYGALQQIAQQGMIRACVQTVADDMTRKWITITGGEESDDDRVSRLQDLVDGKYGLRGIFNRAFATCGYMGGALIYVDTGADDLSLPLAISDLSAELKRGGALRFVVVDPVNASPSEYNCAQPLREDYMRPSRWIVMGDTVHASRLLPIVENEPPTLLKPSYNFLGIPQAQILWDYVIHFNSCRVSAASLLKKISLLVVQTDMGAILESPDGIAQLDARMDVLARYRDNDSVFVCDKEEEAVNNVQTTIAGCTDVVRQALEMIAAINRTPAVKLLGISPSGFNATGESDIRNYYDYVNSKQELHRPQLQKCLDAIQLVEFGEIDPSITFKWNDLNQENEASRAMTAQTRIGALSQLVSLQAMSAEELRQAVRQDESMGLDFLDEEMPDMGEQDELQGAGNPFAAMGGEGQPPQGAPQGPQREVAQGPALGGNA